MNKKTAASGVFRRECKWTRWILAAMTCVLVFSMARPSYADAELSEALINGTAKEGKVVARALHEYNRKQAEIEDKDINLNDGTMLGGKYRYELNKLNARFNTLFAQLQSRVKAVTGTQKDVKRKAALIATHWHRDMYGYGTPEELDRQISTRRAMAGVALVLACIVIGWVPRRVGKPDDDSVPVKVPAELTHITVPGMRYRVNLVTGLVMDKEMWNEIKTTTTYYPNTYGNQVGEVRTESVRKGKAFLLTQDGREEVLNLTGGGHDYRPGNIVTFVFHGRGKKRSAVAEYNHATAKTEEMRGLDEAHGTHWILNLVLTGILAYAAFGWVAAPMQSLHANNGGWWLLAKSAGAALILTALVHFTICRLRNRRFRKDYRQRLEKFLRNADGIIRETFQKIMGAQQKDPGP